MLEFLSLCSDDPEVSKAADGERRYGLILEMRDAGLLQVAAFLSGSPNPASAPARHSSHAARAILELEYPTTDLQVQRQQAELSYRIAQLVSTVADRTQWAGVARELSAPELLSHRAAFYAAIIAKMSEDHDFEAVALRRAADLSPIGSELRTGYLRALAATHWNLGRPNEALKLLEEAFSGDSSDLRWRILEDLVSVSPGTAPLAHTTSAAFLARGLLIRLFENGVPVPGKNGMRFVWRVFAGAYWAAGLQEDWPAVLFHFDEALNGMPHPEAVPEIHELRVRAFLALERLEETFDALDEQLVTRPPDSALLEQEQRLIAIRRAAQLGGKHLKLLTRHPPEGLTLPARARAVITASEHLESADMRTEAVELIAQEMRNYRQVSNLYTMQLARHASSRVLDEGGSGSWQELLELELAQEEDVTALPLLIAKAILASRKDDLASATLLLEQAVRLYTRETPPMPLWPLRKLIVAIARQAQQFGLTNLQSRLVKLGLSFDAPDLDVEPKPAEQASNLLCWAETHLLAVNHQEAMTFAEAGVLALVAPSTEHVAERLILCWLRAFRRSGAGFDEHVQRIVTRLENSLTQCREVKALAILHQKLADSLPRPTSDTPSECMQDPGLTLRHARALVRNLNYSEAIRVLSTKFIELTFDQISPFTEEGVFTLLLELLAISDSDIDPESRVSAALAALQSWRQIAPPDVLPSPDPTLTAHLQYGNADFIVLYRILNTLSETTGQLGHHEDVAAYAGEFIRLYPSQSGLTDWARRTQVISLVALGRYVEAFTALDLFLEEDRVEGAADQEEEGYLHFSGKLRVRIIAALPSETTAAVHMLIGSPPRALHPYHQSKCVQAAAGKLEDWGRTEQAVELVLREAASNAIREDSDAATGLGSFIAERWSQPAWKSAIVEVLADTTNSFGGHLARPLLWRRAFMRHQDGDDIGAADDAFEYTSGDPEMQPTHRYNSRRLLQHAREWVKGSAEEHEITDRLLTRELEIGSPSAPEEPNADYVEELGLWAQTLAAAQSTPEALEVRIEAVEAAARLSDDTMLSEVVAQAAMAFHSAQRTVGAPWIQLLSGFLTDFSTRLTPPVCAILLWRRAYALNASGETAAALDDLAAACELAGSVSLPDYRQLDLINLASDALNWSHELPTVREIARYLIALTDRFTSDTPRFTARAAIKCVRAQLVLGAGSKAAASLRGAMRAIAGQVAPELGDEMFWALEQIEKSYLLDTDEFLALAREIWRSYTSCAGAYPAHWGVWVAQHLIDKGGSDADVVAICAEAHTFQGGGSVKILGFLIDSANAVCAMSRSALARSLLALAAELPDERSQLTKVHETLAHARLSHLEGDPDRAHSQFAQAVETAILIEEDRTRLMSCIAVLLTAAPLDTQLVDHPLLMQTIQEGLAAGISIPDSGGALELALAVRDLTLPTGQGMQRTPNPAHLGNGPLLTIMAVQFGIWKPHLALSNQVLSWFGDLRDRTTGNPSDTMVRAFANFAWAALHLRVVWDLAESRVLEGSPSAAEGLHDTRILDALHALEQALRYAEQGNHTDLIPMVFDVAFFCLDDSLVSENTFRAEAPWVLTGALRWALRIDAFAAQSADLDRRHSLLTRSADIWTGAITLALRLDDSQLIAEIIAARRSSLVFDSSLFSNISVNDDSRPAKTTSFRLREHVALPLEGHPSPVSEDIGSVSAFAHAASAGLLSAVNSGTGMPVRPRPYIRMPDGGLALQRVLSDLETQDMTPYFTPAVITLA